MTTLMKALLILWSAGIAAGCASLPAEYRAPDIALERPTEQAVTEPLPLPEWPIPALEGEGAVYDLAGLQALDDHLVTCEANTAIATEHAETLRLRKAQLNATIDACEALRAHDQRVGDALERERQAHQRDLWLYRGLTGLLLILLVL